MVGLRFGPTGVATAYSLCMLTAILPVTFYLGGRTVPVTTRDLWGSAVAHAPVFVALAATTWLGREWLAPSVAVIPQVFLCLVVGTTAGIGTLLGVPRSRRTVFAMLRHRGQLRASGAVETQTVDVGS
jgi:Na+/H+ antiporter NhaC